MTPVKDWKILRTDKGDFIKIEGSKLLLPLNPDTLYFQDEICDFTLDEHIPFVVYDNGDLQYIYSLKKEDNMLEDFNTYQNLGNDLISPFDFLRSLKLPAPKK